jgi:streptogrisin C
MAESGEVRRSGATVVLIGAALAALLTFNMLPSSSGASEPQGVGKERHPEDVAWLAQDLGISEDEARRRMDIEDAAGELQGQLLDRWPDTLAGMWLSTEGPTTLTVAFTENADDNVSEIAEDFEYPDVLRAEAAAHSITALQAAFSRAVDERGQAQRGQAPTDSPAALRQTQGRFDVTLDERGNGLILHADPLPPGLAGAASRRYGVPVTANSNVSTPTCTRDNCTFSMRGGLRLSFSGTWCSSAFTAYGAATGNRFIVSAGHCGNSYPSTSCAIVPENESGATRSNGGSNYGTVTGEFVRENIDAERIIRSYPSWTEAPVVWVESNDQRTMSGIMPYNNIVVGMQVGKSGVRTGTTRGYITSRSVAPCYVANSYGFLQADYCSLPGDSGGAVFRNNEAVGIVSGGTSTGTSCPSGHRSFFGSAQHAFSRLNLTLLTSGTPPPTTTTTTTTTTAPPPPTTTCVIPNPLGGCLL